MSESETVDAAGTDRPEPPDHPELSEASALDFVDDEMTSEETYRIGFYYVFEVVVTVGHEELVCKLNVLGKTVRDFRLTPSHAETSIGGSAVFATWSLTFSVNWQDRTLHLGGRGCYWDFEWHCKSFDKVLLHF